MLRLASSLSASIALSFLVSFIDTNDASTASRRPSINFTMARHSVDRGHPDSQRICVTTTDKIVVVAIARRRLPKGVWTNAHRWDRSYSGCKTWSLSTNTIGRWEYQARATVDGRRIRPIDGGLLTVYRRLSAAVLFNSRFGFQAKPHWPFIRVNGGRRDIMATLLEELQI